MKTSYKKLLALLLCAGMLFALLPAFAAADGDTELPELPVNPGSVTVLDEELSLAGTNEFSINTPGETVFRPFSPETDGYYRFMVYPENTLGVLADNALTAIDFLYDLQYQNAYEVMYHLHAGETFYFGVHFISEDRTGTANVTIRSFAENACGDYMTWYFDEETGELSLASRSTSPMWDFTPETVPWSAYREQIKTLRLSDNDSISIGSCAFYGCVNLETVENVKSIKGIREYAFYGTALREMVWPDYCYLSGIGEYAFANCKNLKTFTVGKDNWTNGVRAYAFYGSGLETVTIVSNLHDIGEYAFAECKNLKAISLPNEKTSYGDGLTIGDFAFQNCGLQSLWIPKIVEKIGVGVLAGCAQLAPDALTVDPENTVYIAKDGLLQSKDGKTLVAAPYQTASGAYTTPTGVQIVADAAFCGCAALSELTLSPGITTVGENAFTDCTALEQITVPLTLKTIKKDAAQNCPALTDVYYLGTEAERNKKLSVAEDGNDALLSAEWHYTEPDSFDGTVEWDESVQFKGTTPYVVWNGTAFTPGFALKTADGETVDPATYSVEYRENTEAGTAYVFITFHEGYTGTLRLFFKIYLPATTETSIWNIKDGIKLSWKPVPGADGYVIYRRAWNLQSAGWTTFERWNNTTATTWTDKTVYAGTRYQYGVKAYFNQRMDPVTGAMLGGNVGDNYNLGMVGPLKTTVRITTRHLSSLKAGSNTITANWDASKVFTGYEIRYATDENFTENYQTIRITDPTASSAVLKSLKKGKVYYVSLRSYHVFEGMTYYGQWSNVIRVKTGSGQTMYDVMYRAVAVGENTYSQSPLNGCVNDMNSMAGMLKGLKRPFTVKTLANAKKTAIINGIRSAFADAWDNDVSLFCYSGHGVNASGSSDYQLMQGALVSVDMQYITMQELAQELSKVRGRVIVILDSCHSGAAIARSTEDESAALEAFNQAAIEAFSGYYLETDEPSENYGTRMGEFRQSKFIVITAASYSHSSYDGKFDGSGYYQGAFTAALIKGMGCKYAKGAYTGSMPADRNGDGKITLKELFDYASDQASDWVPQRAQYYGSDNEVLFCR